MGVRQRNRVFPGPDPVSLFEESNYSEGNKGEGVVEVLRCLLESGSFSNWSPFLKWKTFAIIKYNQAICDSCWL